MRDLTCTTAAGFGLICFGIDRIVIAVNPSQVVPDPILCIAFFLGIIAIKISGK